MRRYFLIPVLLLAACGQPDCPKNSDIDGLGKYTPESDRYQRNLRQMVQNHPDDVAYYFERRDTLDGRPYLVVNCYGDGFCGQMRVRVDQNEGSAVVLQNNRGYRGARLDGFAWILQSADNREEAVYAGLRKIID